MTMLWQAGPNHQFKSKFSAYMFKYILVDRGQNSVRLFIYIGTIISLKLFKSAYELMRY